MPFKPEELTPEQKLDRQYSAMGDSVDLINRLIAEGKHTQQAHDTIERNVKHLELMLGKDLIKNSNKDLKPSQDAVAAGNTFIAQPVVAETNP
mgnify:CR=1 FL=1